MDYPDQDEDRDWHGHWQDENACKRGWDLDYWEQLHCLRRSVGLLALCLECDVRVQIQNVFQIFFLWMVYLASSSYFEPNCCQSGVCGEDGQETADQTFLQALTAWCLATKTKTIEDSWGELCAFIGWTQPFKAMVQYRGSLSSILPRDLHVT